MSNYFSEKTIDLKILESMFEDWVFSCLEVSAGLDDSEVLTVFCCQTKRLECMQREWMEVNSHIAAEFLRKNKSIFERWNTYLLFVCTEGIPRNIQYEIENNKFSMRKIISKKKIHFLNVDELSCIANKKILSSNVQLTENESSLGLDLDLSEITTRLLVSEVGVSQRQPDREGREQWLNDELVRINLNEN